MQLKYALKELGHQKRFCALFVATLALSLSSFVAVSHLKSSLQNSVAERSREIHAADLKISSRQIFSSKEQEIIFSSLPEKYRQSKSVELFSMLRTSNGASRLVQVKAIDQNYPLYGKLKLEAFDRASKNLLFSSGSTWVYPEVNVQLGLEGSHSFELGSSKVKSTHIVADDSASNAATGFAPRVYVSFETLKKSGLQRPGSLLWHSYSFAFEDISLQKLENLRTEIFKKLERPGIVVTTHKTASQQSNRLIDYLSDFLGLVSVAALLLGSIGVYFLCHSFVQNNLKSFGILLSIGMTSKKALGIYLIELCVLGLSSAVIALLISSGIIWFLNYFLSDYINFMLLSRLSVQTIAVTMMVGLLCSFLTALPILLHKREQSIVSFLSSTQQVLPARFFQRALYIVPNLLFYLALSVWISQSWFNGGMFLLFILVSGLLCFFVFSVLLRLKISNLFRSQFSLQMALRNIFRKPFSNGLVFLSLSIGMLLVSIVPQMQHTLSSEIKKPEDSKIPSLFLFDVQDEQMPGIQSLVESFDIRFTKILPMVRARLRKVNDKSFEKGIGRENAKSREEQREMAFRNRGFNLTYQDELSDSERVYRGPSMDGMYNPASNILPQISLEKRFAERLNLHIGDRLEFDIQGVPVAGKVHNLRSVDWTSFEPNFFITFQRGILEEAPKTYLASIEKLKTKDKNFLQNKIVASFPNISIIDVERLASKLIEVMQVMGRALRLMSIISLLVGLSVIFAILRYQGSTLRWDIALQKVLGMSSRQIYLQYLFQYALLSLIATLLGFSLSVGLNFFISYFVFEKVIQPQLIEGLGLSFGIVFTSISIVWFAMRKYFKSKPRSLMS